MGLARYLSKLAALVGSDGKVPAAGLASGAAVSNIGYTPVNKAGDTVTGLIDSTFAFKDITPAVRLTTSDSADLFKHPSHMLAPSMTTGQSVIAVVGRTANTADAAWFGFQYSGTPNSVNNIGAVGMWGKNNVITWDSRGAVRKQYNPAFKAYMNANYTLNGSNRTPSYGQEVFDNGANYDPSSSTFTAPVDGVYAFQIGIGSQGASTAVFLVTEIQVNGVTRNDNTAASHSASVSNNTNNTELGSHVTFIIKLAANDAIKPLLYAPADVTLSATGGWPSTRNYFSGFLVG